MNSSLTTIAAPPRKPETFPGTKPKPRLNILEQMEKDSERKPTFFDWTSELPLLTEDELHRLEMTLLEDTIQIRLQVDSALHKQETGIEIDTGWLVKAQSALRYKRARLQLAQRESGKRRRDEKRNNHFAVLFLKTAKDVLPPDLYGKIYASAQGQHF